MRIPQTNKLTPEFFYESVAKKTGVPKEIVKDVYSKYLSRVQEVARKEKKIMIKGLGTFQMSPNKVIARLHLCHNSILDHPEGYFAEEMELVYYTRIVQASEYLKHLNQLKIKYEHIEKSLENIWSNQRGLPEFLTREGVYRRDIRKKDDGLQQLSEEEWT